MSTGNTIDKVVPSADDAVADIAPGSSLAVGGFGLVGIPWTLIGALLEQEGHEIGIRPELEHPAL